jgi:hypothetical protein
MLLGAAAAPDDAEPALACPAKGLTAGTGVLRYRLVASLTAAFRSVTAASQES